MLNVVDFGAFVDVGLSDSGLVHVSQLKNDFVRDPHEVVAVGDQVDCWVTNIDLERRRVALTMIEPGTEQPKPEKPKSRHRHRPKKPKPEAGDAPARAKSTKDKPRENRRGKRGDRRGKQQERPRERSGSYEKRAKREVVPITKEIGRRQRSHAQLQRSLAVPQEASREGRRAIEWRPVGRKQRCVTCG